MGGFAQLRLAAPIVASRSDRVVLRGETTVGSGAVLDPSPARHADPVRFERAQHGETQIHEPVLVEGAWRFSDEWLAELHDVLEQAIDEADPLDPGVPAPTEPWARGRARAAAVRAPRLAALPAGHDRHARRARGKGRAARGGASRRQSRGPRRPTTPSSPASCEATGRSSGSATAGRSQQPPTSGRERSCSRSARPRVRSRSPASATSPAVAAATLQLLLERLDADGVTRRAGRAQVLRRRVVPGLDELDPERPVARSAPASPAPSADRITSLTSRSLKPAVNASTRKKAKRSASPVGMFSCRISSPASAK